MEKILLIIGSQIECLNINNINLSFPLSYFPNIKSLIFSSAYNLSNEELKLIVENKQFINLKSFKIKENKFYSEGLHYDRVIDQNLILNKIFNNKNSLETFEYLFSRTPFRITSMQNFEINFNLYSLSLTLNYFRMFFNIIKYTPNLIYLNIQSQLSDICIISTDNINIKLKQLHLTLYMDSDRMMFCDGRFNTIKRFSLILNLIKQFSSSLNCLSLNLARLNIENVDNFACNSLKLKEFLEPMKQLKEFHLYNKLFLSPIDNDRILSEFKSEYWFDHNLSFGMHFNYFYTLPFQFNHIYEFYQDFNFIKSNNPQILINNHRIWYHVKSIQLPFAHKYDQSFVKELKIKMPKLTSIKFTDPGG